MKKILTLFSIFLLGSVLIFLIYQYNQKTTVQLSLRETLEYNVETVLNNNLDSSFRVYELGNSLIDPYKFEEELKESFKNNGTINTSKFDTEFKFEYLISRNKIQHIISADEYQIGDIITAVKTTALINDQEYTVSFILDIKQ